MDSLKAQLDVAQKSKTALTSLFDSIQEAIDSLTGTNATASFASAKATLDSVLAIAQAWRELTISGELQTYIRRAENN